MPDYRLPDVGEGLTEAEIVTWRVTVGDTVAVNDVVVEIETAKSVVELPSPYAGTVAALLVDAGQVVEVGTPIIRIGEETAAGEPPPRPAPPEMDLSNPAATGGGEGESLVGRTKADRAPERRARRTAAEAAPVPVTSVQVLAKPPVRKLARDLGVDLVALAADGTGPHGSISREDVQAAAGATESVAVSRMPERYDDLGRPGVAPLRGAREQREPVKGVRKAMSEAMVASAFTVPHVTEWVTVDVTSTMELVVRLKARPEFREVAVSPLLVLARAVCLATRRTPIVNSTWDAQAQEVVLKGYVNLGIAAATPRGLVVPNIKDADAMSLVELAGALGDLVATARAGKTQPADQAGGTFTITNIGPFGIDGGTPIINPGESAILAFGTVSRRPWVVTGADGGEALAIRDLCTLSLSFDHRHIDGAAGSRFLADVAGIMADPATALLF